jgi:hypothetical protein
MRDPVCPNPKTVPRPPLACPSIDHEWGACGRSGIRESGEQKEETLQDWFSASAESPYGINFLKEFIKGIIN